jgi:hypothetical protein
VEKKSRERTDLIKSYQQKLSRSVAQLSDDEMEAVINGMKKRLRDFDTSIQKHIDLLISQQRQTLSLEWKHIMNNQQVSSSDENIVTLLEISALVL